MMAFISIVVVVFMFVAQWKLFEKLGKPGWASLIPIYNLYILIHDIAKKPGWYVVLYLIPIAQLYVWYVVSDAIAKRFGKDIGFTIGIFLIPYVFLPILAFSKKCNANEDVSVADNGTNDADQGVNNSYNTMESNNVSYDNQVNQMNQGFNQSMNVNQGYQVPENNQGFNSQQAMPDQMMEQPSNNLFANDFANSAPDYNAANNQFNNQFSNQVNNQFNNQVNNQFNNQYDVNNTNGNMVNNVNGSYGGVPLNGSGMPVNDPVMQPQNVNNMNAYGSATNGFPNNIGQGTENVNAPFGSPDGSGNNPENINGNVGYDSALAYNQSPTQGASGALGEEMPQGVSSAPFAGNVEGESSQSGASNPDFSGLGSVMTGNPTASDPSSAGQESGQGQNGDQNTPQA